MFVNSPITVIWVALFLHWIFDFVLQSHKMSINKSKSFKWLTIHCLVYGLMAIPFYILFLNSIKECVIFYMILFFSHLIIDGITSKINSWLWNKKEVHWFFVSIGFDQILHYTILLFLVKPYA